MRRWAVGVVIVLAVVVGVIVWSAERGGDEWISRPWTTAAVSDDGLELTVWVEKPGDPACEVFDHLDVDRSERTAVVSAIYRRTDQDTCIVPCPLEDEAHTVTLDEPLGDLDIVHSPDAVDSCR
ncbi:hypothetical protein [Actinospongicola halichondriae]|uniref:hypothetical protein n=1 Tax=Actinospongicola halichondriae TaxID=3236844 RepID=UPI003D5A374E